MSDSTSAKDGQSPAEAGHGQRTAAKGRPTPKRSEAERRRRPPVGAPPATKKAGRGNAADRRTDRVNSRVRYAANLDAMKRGDQSAMKAADRGPVKQLARDYIDTRRVLLSEWVLFGMVALIIVAVIFSATAGKHGRSGSALGSAAMLYVELAVVAIVIIEGAFYGTRAARLAQQRHPGQSTRGLVWYVTRRIIRLRATRVPPPRNGITRGGAF